MMLQTQSFLARERVLYALDAGWRVCRVARSLAD